MADHAKMLQAVTDIRRALRDMSNEERRETLIMVAVCPQCGEDHSDFYDRRGFFSCDCEGED